VFASHAAAQTTLELDRIGVQQHRDYLRLQPFEQIDTQASNLIVTLSDLCSQAMPATTCDFS
jgi:hypothetical protein